MWKKFKKSTPSLSQNFLRTNHRKIGIIISFLTVTFAFSGGYHAIQKWEPNILPKIIYEPIIKVSDIKIQSTKINVNWSQLINSSLVKFKNQYYYQCDVYDVENEKGQKQFINAKTNVFEKNIEIQYAQYLVSKFKIMLLNPDTTCCEMQTSARCKSNFTLKSSSILNEFDNREYGFVNKRLPVVKLEYNSSNSITYYIETSTSRLASVVSNSTRYEGYSFAVLHKFLFLDWAGKNIRDFITVISALGLLAVSVLGLILFIKTKPS